MQLIHVQCSGINWKKQVRRLKHIKEVLDEAGIEIPGINAPSKTSPAEPRPERDDGNNDPGRGTGGAVQQSSGDGLADRLVEGILQDAVRDREPVGVE